MSEKEEIIQKIGALILADLQDLEWDSIALVSDLANDQKNEFGYRYVGSDIYEGWGPGTFETITLMVKLRELMVSDGDKPWHQALVHIVRKGLTFNIQFEYDDPARWSMKSKSLDIGEYAFSLRPPADL